MPKDQVVLENTTNPSAVVHQVIARSGFMVMMNTKIMHASRGQVSLQVARQPNLLQLDGYFHGGVIASLADYAGACASAVSEEDGVPVLTSHLSVTYLAAAKGEVLHAEATCVKSGHRLRSARVDILSGTRDALERVAVADVLVSVTAP